MWFLTFLLLEFAFLFVRNIHATCYWPDGSLASTDYAPCNYGVTSMCCDTANNDTCTPEGLCLYEKSSYNRDACTDPTWKSPICLGLCLCSTTEIQTFAELGLI